MEQHFSPEKLPEFLYPEKESEKNHQITYLDKRYTGGLKVRFNDWFHVSEDITKFAELAKGSDLNLILFAFVPKKGADFTKLWTSLCSIIDKYAKESENPCFFVKEKVPGILVNSSSIKYSEKLSKKIIENFALDNKTEAISGISYFPCLDYTLKNVVQNAEKALVHASMLEETKMAVFDSISLNVSSDEYFQKKNIEKAVAELEKALLLNKKDTNVLNSLGVCHAVQKDFEQASLYFEKAAQISPDPTMPSYNLGLVYYLDQKKDKAKEILKQAFKKGFDYFGIPFYLGKIEYELENYSKAMDYFLKADKLKPDNAAVLNFIGAVFLIDEDFDNAYSYYKRALKIFPHNAYALSALGYIYLKRGENMEIAETFMRQSTEIEPYNTLFRQRLNLILKEKKNKNELKKAAEI